MNFVGGPDELGRKKLELAPPCPKVWVKAGTRPSCGLAYCVGNVKRIRDLCRGSGSDQHISVQSLVIAGTATTYPCRPDRVGHVVYRGGIYWMRF